MLPRSRFFLPGPFFLSTIGILFSLWNLWGDPEVLCLTDGCYLFQNLTVAGISLWWLGLVGFSLLCLLALAGTAWLGMLCAALGLFLDCVLMLVMFFVLPCFNCLIIGLLLALTYWRFRATEHELSARRHPLGRSWLMATWLLLFVFNCGTMLQGLAQPWALRSPSTSLEEATVHLYVSPSCSACRDLINSAGSTPSSTAAWYLIAEKQEDLFTIDVIQQRMAAGDSPAQALAQGLAATQSLPANRDSLSLLKPKMLLLQLRLWKNNAHVMSAGSNRLPFVEYRGIPHILGGQAASAPNQSSTPPAVGSGGTGIGTLPFLDTTGFCQENVSDC